MRWIVIVLLWSLPVACAVMSSTEQEGVEFLDDNRLQATFCYAYSLEQGRMFARTEVKKIAIRELMGSYKATILSEFSNRMRCVSGQCNQSAESYLQQVSNNVIERMNTQYFQPNDNKMCVTATADFSESMAVAAQQLGFDWLSSNQPVVTPPQESVRSCELLGGCQ